MIGKKGIVVIAFILLASFSKGVHAESDCSLYEKALMSTIYPYLDEAIATHYGEASPYTFVNMQVSQKEKEAFFEVTVNVYVKEKSVDHVDEITFELHPTSIKQTNYRTISSSKVKHKE